MLIPAVLLRGTVFGWIEEYVAYHLALGSDRAEHNCGDSARHAATHRRVGEHTRRCAPTAARRRPGTLAG